MADLLINYTYDDDEDQDFVIDPGLFKVSLNQINDKPEEIPGIEIKPAIDKEKSPIVDAGLESKKYTEPQIFTPIVDLPPPQIFPKITTILSSPVGKTKVLPDGTISVDVTLDCEDLIGVSKYEVRVTPE
jgi:hypothetical protein